MNKLSEKLTATELANKYGVSRQAVRNLAKKGIIKFTVGANNLMLFDENVTVPTAWLHGEKGRKAFDKWGGVRDAD